MTVAGCGSWPRAPTTAICTSPPPGHGILIFARDGAVVEEDVAGSPDLAVHDVWASTEAAFTGGVFRLGAVVRNRGGGRADVTLRFYQSTDTTVTTADTEVASVSLGRLAGANTRGRSVQVVAPSTAGTCHYGACADTVAGEADVANNCSAGVAVTVREDEEDEDEGDGYCRPGTIVEPGGACTVYRLGYNTFDVDSNGRGCLRASFTGCSGQSLGFGFGSLTFVAARREDNSWEIENVDPAPPD